MTYKGPTVTAAAVQVPALNTHSVLYNPCGILLPGIQQTVQNIRIFLAKGTKLYRTAHNAAARQRPHRILGLQITPSPRKNGGHLPVLPATSSLSLSKTQKIFLNIRSFSIYAGTTGICAPRSGDKGVCRHHTPLHR